MAMQPDIQYVPFYYVDGSTARKVQRQPEKEATAAPAQNRRRAKQKVIAVDPVAIGGICVAMVSANGDMLPLCSTEYVERDHKVRVFGHNGRINELDVSIEKAPQTRRCQETVPGNASFRLRMA